MKQNDIKDNTVQVNADAKVTANVPVSVNGNSLFATKKENSQENDSQNIENHGDGNQTISNSNNRNNYCTIL